MAGYVSPLAAWIVDRRRSAVARLAPDDFCVLSTDVTDNPEIEDLRRLFLIERRELQNGKTRQPVPQYRLTLAGRAMLEAMGRWASPDFEDMRMAGGVSADMIVAGARALAAQRMRRRAMIDGSFDKNRLRRVARAEALLEDPSLIDNLLAADHGYVEDAMGALLAAFREGVHNDRV